MKVNIKDLETQIEYLSATLDNDIYSSEQKEYIEGALNMLGHIAQELINEGNVNLISE